jgi:type 1 glutamine amidotransferase
MRRFFQFAMAIALLALAATPAAAAEKGTSGKIRVLLTTGGHGFEAEPFYAMFDAMEDVEYTKAEMPKDADLLKPGLEKDFDVIVMYDMCKPGITPQQQQAFVKLLNKGIGLVSLHHNMGAHQTWDEFPKIIGGKFCTAACTIDGKECEKSGWSHGETLDVKVADKEHPVTRGIDDFQIHDETYNNYYTAPDVKVLLTTDNPKNDPELAWVKTYGKSPVLFLMLGHDGQAYGNPSYSKLVHQGIRWAAGK